MNDPKPTPAYVAEQFRKTADAATKVDDALKDLKAAHEKKPYVRPEHLMDRPFRDNPGLVEMRNKLQAQERRRPRNPKQQRQR